MVPIASHPRYDHQSQGYCLPCFLYHKPFYCGLCLTNLSKSSNPLTAKIILLLLLFSLLIHRSPFVTAQEPREPLTCAEHVQEGYTLRLTRAVITTVFDIPHLQLGTSSSLVKLATRAMRARSIYMIQLLNLSSTKLILTSLTLYTHGHSHWSSLGTSY